MVLVKTLAAAVFAPAALALNWGDACGAGRRGTCVATSECRAFGGKSTVGDCPGLPDNVRCCTAPGCKWTTDNKCPQFGPDVKWVNEWGVCALVEFGKCPGHTLYRKVGPLDWVK